MQLEVEEVMVGQTQLSTEVQIRLLSSVSPVQMALAAGGGSDKELQKYYSRRTGAEAGCVDTTGDAATDPFLLAALVGLDAPASEG